MVLFKNPHDKYQILLIARQMFPCRTKCFLEPFADATSTPYGYLLVDFKATTPTHYGQTSAGYISLIKPRNGNQDKVQAIVNPI